MKTDADNNLDRFESLAEQFSCELREGKSPAIDRYATEYPELEARIRRLFPILEMMEVDGSSPDDWQELNSIEEELNRHHLPNDLQFGDFKILSEIGRGGMGVVYLATQTSLQRKVALKILPDTVQFDSRRKQRFLREARASAMLHHTNIVPIFDIGEHDGVSFYSMQYIEGQSLNRVVKSLSQRSGTDDSGSTVKLEGGIESTLVESLVHSPRFIGKSTPSKDATVVSGKVDPQESKDDHPGFTLEPINVSLPNIEFGTTYWNNIAKMGMQIAQAVAHAHGKGLLHRDIKPSNLLLDESGDVWVTDFGLAKSLNSPDLTRTGEVVGTLRYMSPEQMNGNAETRSDVFGIGLTLYEMLALRPAYDAENREKLVTQIIEAAPPNLRLLNRNIPRDLATIVHKCIEPQAEKRYATGTELAADLQRFLDRVPVSARETRRVERVLKWCGRHPLTAGLTASLMLSLIAGILGVSYQWSLTAAALKKAETNMLIAKDQSELALDTLSNVISDIQSLLDDNTVSTATAASQRARHRMLKGVFRGMKNVSMMIKQQTDYSESLIALHLELGDLYIRIGKEDGFGDATDEARTEFLYALAIAKRYHESCPDDHFAARKYSYVVERLAQVDLFAYKFSDAARQYREAIEITEASVAANPDVHKGFSQLAYQYYWMAVTEFRRFRLKEASDWYTKSIEVIGTVQEKFPEDMGQQITNWLLPNAKQSLLITSNLEKVRADIGFANQFEASVRPRMLYDCAAWQAFDGDHKSAAQTLESILEIEGLGATDWYSNACGYGRCAKALLDARELSGLSLPEQELFGEYENQAVFCLKKSRETGMFEHVSAIGLLARDADLKPFRDRDPLNRFIEALLKP